MKTVKIAGPDLRRHVRIPAPHKECARIGWRRLWNFSPFSCFLCVRDILGQRGISNIHFKGTALQSSAAHGSNVFSFCVYPTILILNECAQAHHRHTTNRCMLKGTTCSDHDQGYSVVANLWLSVRVNFPEVLARRWVIYPHLIDGSCIWKCALGHHRCIFIVLCPPFKR